MTLFSGLEYRLTWRLPLAGLVAFSHLQFSQIRGRQPYSIVRKIPYLIISESLVRVNLVVVGDPSWQLTHDGFGIWSRTDADIVALDRANEGLPFR